MILLETKALSKNFSRLAALVNVHMDVNQGEIFGIAGPNGAGKSTFFNIIAGVYPPSSGKVFFNGNDITGLSSYKICHRGIARTFQTPTTFKTLNVYDNIRVGATFGSGKDMEDCEKIESTIQFLGLHEVKYKVAGNLDLYTTKLVMLGSALATQCKMLMLDEPLAGLSPLEIKNFLDVIRKLNQEDHVTILMIEHLLDSLIEISDRVLILHNGQVIYTGSPGGMRTDEKVVEVYLGNGQEAL